MWNRKILTLLLKLIIEIFTATVAQIVNCDKVKADSCFIGNYRYEALTHLFPTLIS